MSQMGIRSLLLGGLLFAAAGMAHSQDFSVAPCGDHNGEEGGWFSQSQACEIRRAVLPTENAHLGVAGKNGSIEVIGEDRRDIALEARVTTTGSSHSDAEDLLHQVRIVTTDTIHAEGPERHGFTSHGWSVSFKLRVPRRMLATDLHTSNGPISAADLQGRLTAESTNGSIHLDHIGGDVRASSTNGPLNLQEIAGTVHAETTNGGVQVSLAGPHWQGNSLFAKSTNGGVALKAPSRFSAHLVAHTTNGGISVDFPTEIQGKIGRSIDTNVNGGGPQVQLETTNGGISVERI